MIERQYVPGAKIGSVLGEPPVHFNLLIGAPNLELAKQFAAEAGCVTFMLTPNNHLLCPAPA